MNVENLHTFCVTHLHLYKRKTEENLFLYSACVCIWWDMSCAQWKTQRWRDLSMCTHRYNTRTYIYIYVYMNNTISAYSLRVYINECIFCNVARVAWGPTVDATLLHVLKNIYTHTHNYFSFRFCCSVPITMRGERVQNCLSCPLNSLPPSAHKVYSC